MLGKTVFICSVLVFLWEEGNLRFSPLTDGETKEPEFVFLWQLQMESERAYRALEVVQAEVFTLAGLRASQESLTQTHSLKAGEIFPKAIQDTDEGAVSEVGTGELGVAGGLLHPVCATQPLSCLNWAPRA